MALDKKSRELIALGAAIGGNCIPCLRWHFKQCLKLAVSIDEIKEAADIAFEVKQVPIKLIHEAYDQLLDRHTESEAKITASKESQ